MSTIAERIEAIKKANDPAPKKKTSLAHSGKKGMKWGHHTYAKPPTPSDVAMRVNNIRTAQRTGSPQGTNMVKVKGRVQQTQNRVTAKESEQKINSKGHYTGSTSRKALKKDYSKMSSKEVKAAVADMRNKANLARANADMTKASFDAKAAKIRNFASGVRTAADIASGAATIKKSYNTLMGKETYKLPKKSSPKTKSTKFKGSSKSTHGYNTGFAGKARDAAKTATTKGTKYVKKATKTASTVKSTASDELNAARARAQAALAKSKKKKK